jgi:uncharacterized Zn-finger protein
MYAKPAAVPLSAPTAQQRTGDYLPKLEGRGEDDDGDGELVDHGVDCNSSVEALDFPVEVISTWIGEVSSSSDYEQPKIPSASGLQCILCGARFTRRSNCREHMKRHDPSGRKSFPCEECGKILGRKTDLKRHIDSVCIYKSAVEPLFTVANALEGSSRDSQVWMRSMRCPLQST